MHRRRFQISGFDTAPAVQAALVLLLSLLSSTAGAQAGQCDNGSCPSTFDIVDMPIQRSPNRFKFQTRISQAKLPVGDAVFPVVIVNLNDGSGVVCTETHANVKVNDSVLNLEIGSGFDCPLDEILARSAGLSFQICLGGLENCLPPVALSSVPYAAKANFAYRAQQAHNADVAAQCHYAHRVTADTSLFVTQEIGSGYYDFHTPSRTDLLSLGDGTSNESIEGGYLQWTPVDPTKRQLNICGKDLGTNQLVPLSDLMLHAGLTLAKGDFTVEGDGIVNRTLNVLGSTHVGGNLDVDLGATIGQTLHAQGATTLSSTLDVAGATQISNTLVVTGDSTLEEATVNASALVKQTLTAEGLTEAKGGLTVNNTFLATGSASVQGPMTIGQAAGAGQLTVNYDAEFDGTINLDGNVRIGEDLDENTMIVNHKTVFNGTVVMAGGAGVAADVVDLNVSNKITTKDITATGAVDLTGATVTGLGIEQIGMSTTFYHAEAFMSALGTTQQDMDDAGVDVTVGLFGAYKQFEIVDKTFCSLIKVSVTSSADATTLGNCTLSIKGAGTDDAYMLYASPYQHGQTFAGKSTWLLSAIAGFSSSTKCGALCF